MSIPQTSLLWLMSLMCFIRRLHGILYLKVFWSEGVLFLMVVLLLFFCMSPMFSSVTILEVSVSFLICIKHYLHAVEAYIHITVT